MNFVIFVLLFLFVAFCGVMIGWFARDRCQCDIRIHMLKQMEAPTTLTNDALQDQGVELQTLKRIADFEDKLKIRNVFTSPQLG